MAMGHRGENETSCGGERSNHFCGNQNLHQQQVTTKPASKIVERETKAVMLGANPGRTLLFDDLDMKAKVIKTGEVVEVHKTTTGWASDNLNTTRFFNESELDFDYRKWEDFRMEAAKDILCTMVGGGYGRGREKGQAALAVQYANELIEALREEKK